jgi:DNA-damage-inducible protein D
VSDKHTANVIHHEVGRKIRETIAEFGNTMPEDLPAPDKSIKQLETKNAGN